jgi:hypothetical protein
MLKGGFVDAAAAAEIFSDRPDCPGGAGFAPIGACWAASIAASDPLHAAIICHGDTASAQGQTNPTDPTGQQRAHDGCCSACSVLHTGAPVDTPQTAVAAPRHQPERVIWLDNTPDLFSSRAGSHAQARAPPPIS